MKEEEVGSRCSMIPSFNSADKERNEAMVMGADQGKGEVLVCDIDLRCKREISARQATAGMPNLYY